MRQNVKGKLKLHLHKVDKNEYLQKNLVNCFQKEMMTKMANRSFIKFKWISKDKKLFNRLKNSFSKYF
jgi:hypothetical protein